MDELGAEGAVALGVERLRLELGERRDELRMRDAAGERVPLEPVARFEQSRRERPGPSPSCLRVAPRLEVCRLDPSDRSRVAGLLPVGRVSKAIQDLA